MAQTTNYKIATVFGKPFLKLWSERLSNLITRPRTRTPPRTPPHALPCAAVCPCVQTLRPHSFARASLPCVPPTPIIQIVPLSQSPSIQMESDESLLLTALREDSGEHVFKYIIQIVPLSQSPSIQMESDESLLLTALREDSGEHVFKYIAAPDAGRLKCAFTHSRTQAEPKRVHRDAPKTCKNCKRPFYPGPNGTKRLLCISCVREEEAIVTWKIRTARKEKGHTMCFNLECRKDATCVGVVCRDQKIAIRMKEHGEWHEVLACAAHITENPMAAIAKASRMIWLG